MEKPKPNLIVLTGYPSCGKSSVSRYLAEKEGYTRLSGDEISVELFGHTYPYKENEDPERIWKELCRRRDEALREGKSVVIDTTAYNEEKRKELFGTRVACDRYLVWLKVSPKATDARLGRRGWSKEAIEDWKADASWEDPKEGKGYRLLEYRNEEPGDLRRVQKELLELVEKK